MYTTQQNSSADDHIRAGYYPDHKRVVELERMAGEGAVFSLPNGQIISQGPDRRSRGNVFALTSANRKNGLKITPETSVPQWYGDKMDNGVAVDMLLQCE
jgi:hypothetical protein